MWDQAAHCSKANKQARLVERKVHFISDASNWEGAGQETCPTANSPSTGDQWGKSLHRQKAVGVEGGRGKATCRNSTVISISPLHIGLQWSDQHHLGCFKVWLNFSSRVHLFQFL